MDNADNLQFIDINLYRKKAQKWHTLHLEIRGQYYYTGNKKDTKKTMGPHTPSIPALSS